MAESGTMRVEVVSPERVLFSGDATQVITRTLEGGEVAFLPGHAAFLGALTENHVTILSDAAELEEDIDVTRARAAKQRAEEQMRGEHSAEVETDLRRAHARLAATGGIDALAH